MEKYVALVPVNTFWSGLSASHTSEILLWKEKGKNISLRTSETHVAFHQVASLMRLSCLYRSTVTNLPLFSLSAAPPDLVLKRSLFIFRKPTSTLEFVIHILALWKGECTRFSPFWHIVVPLSLAACCSETLGRRCFKFDYFFRGFIFAFSFLTPQLPVFTSWLPVQYLPTGSVLAIASEVRFTGAPLKRTMFLFQDSFYVPSAWTSVPFVWGKVNRTIFRMMCLSVLKQHYSGLYPPPFRLWKDVSLKELNMEIKADLY